MGFYGCSGRNYVLLGSLGVGLYNSMDTPTHTVDTLLNHTEGI
jgi:hypothetical protein